MSIIWLLDDGKITVVLCTHAESLVHSFYPVLVAFFHIMRSSFPSQFPPHYYLMCFISFHRFAMPSGQIFGKICCILTKVKQQCVAWFLSVTILIE